MGMQQIHKQIHSGPIDARALFTMTAIPIPTPRNPHPLTSGLTVEQRGLWLHKVFGVPFFPVLYDNREVRFHPPG